MWVCAHDMSINSKKKPKRQTKKFIKNKQVILCIRFDSSQAPVGDDCSKKNAAAEFLCTFLMVKARLSHAIIHDKVKIIILQ